MDRARGAADQRRGAGRVAHRAAARHHAPAGHRQHPGVVRAHARRVHRHAGQAVRRPRVHLERVRVDRHRRRADRPVDTGRSPERDDDAHHHRGRVPHPRVLGRVHGSRPRLPAVLRVHEPVRVRDAAAGTGRQLLLPHRGLGVRGPGVVSADRLLVRAPHGGGRRQEGLRGQRDRRRGAGARGLPDPAPAGHARLRRGLRTGRPGGRAVGHRAGHLPSAVRGRRRQERAGAAAHLAARRHGGPHAGQRADPRRHHGDSRRVPDRALP